MAEKQIARLVPDEPFPPYAFVPGRLPHPTSDPAGHSFGKEPAVPSNVDPERWHECRPYLQPPTSDPEPIVPSGTNGNVAENFASRPHRIIYLVTLTYGLEKGVREMGGPLAYTPSGSSSP